MTSLPLVKPRFIFIATLLLLVVLLGSLVSLSTRAAPLGQPTLDLAVTKYKESGNFAPGHYVKYVVVFQNASLFPADGIFIRDTLPLSTTYASSTGPGLTPVQLGPDKVVWHKGHLSDYEMGWASITVRVADDAPVGATMSNIVRIWDGYESNFDNNEYILREEVLPPGPDLAVRKELQSGIVDGGNQISYHIHYDYNGASATHNVRISDTLPASATYVSDVNYAGFTTVMTGSTVVWEKSSVAADSSGDLYLNVLIDGDFDPNADWLENVVEISTSDAETNYDNNLNRFTIKPEGDKYYGAAVTSVDDKTMQLLSAGGFDWMIYYLDWSETEPSKGTYNWRDLDSAIWQAWRYHLKLAVRIDRAPDWARPPGSGETAPPTNPDDLRDFVDAIADRTKVPRIDAYIVWNEPNLASEWGGQPPNAADYVDLLDAAYQGVNGRGLVVSAGLATTNGGADSVDDCTYLQQMYDVPGAGGFFDLLGANPMGFASAPDDSSDPNNYNFMRALEWRNIMQLNGDGAKKMFATEVGWLRDTDEDLGSYNWMKVSDIDQAHYLALAYHKAQRQWPWMQAMMLWNMDFSAHYSDTEHLHWFSVTGDDLSPLRSYLTLKNAATRGPADLWVEKELVSDIKYGEVMTYVIRYTNIGGQPASGVRLTDTLPVGTTYLTDTKSGTPVDGKVVWNLGTVDTTGTRERITLTLHLAGSASVSIISNTVEAGVVPGEPYTDDNIATVISNTDRTSTYLPVIPKGDGAPAPDLVVKGISATGYQVQVVIKNQGVVAVPVSDEFWVDLYIAPREIPTYNKTWPLIADQGAAWGVTAPALPLEPGEELTLITGGAYYWPSKSSISWPLAQGTPVYAQVDSANASTTYGVVMESNESNNVSGQFTVQGLGAASPPGAAEGRPEEDISKTSLPPRP